MVRALLATPRDGKRRLDRVGHGRQLADAARLVVVFVLVGFSGCSLVPRSRMDECQRLSQTLRGDNAHLRDRLLAVQSENRDYAERAVDDGRRLAIQDAALERLEHSVQAYQDDVTRLEAAYKKLASNLSVADRETDGERIVEGSRATRADGAGSPASARNSSSTTDMDGSTPH
jgi:hypothetical protein